VHYGSVPEDPALHSAVRLRKAVVESFPSSPSGIAFKELARRADKWTVQASSAGRPVFFLERTLAAARPAFGRP
jgi:flagellar biosynthesis protein FlhG